MKQNDKSRNSDTAANLEPYIVDEPLGAKKIAGLNPPYRLHVHVIRKRLCDVDGISAKAAIDGLVKARIFPDDSAQFIEEITYSQEKGKEEKTIITIDEID